MKFFSILLLFLLAIGCGSPADHPVTPDYEVAPPAPNPLAPRVRAATERLNATPAGKKVLSAIEAHGGLATWYARSPLYFHFNYQPLDGGNQRNTLILNDYVNSRAVHASAQDTSQIFGFDGQDAWSMTGEKVAGMSPRFWSLTPYYFVGLPFVLADEGINFEQLPAATMNGQNYDLIKVTYAAGTGDAADDYYVLYLNTETRELDALRYIVSYPGFFPDGGNNPEKLMTLTGKVTVDGIVLPTGYDTRWWENGTPSEPITTIDIRDYEFRPETDPAAFDRPAEAKIYNDLPQTER